MNKSLILTCLALLNLGISWQAGATAAQAYNKIRPLIFQVKTSASQSLEKSSYGTGFVIDKAGLIMTNYHVVADAIWNGDKLKSYVIFGTENLEAQILNVDFVNDLALLKVDHRFPGQIQLADELPVKGSEIFSLGLPEDLEWSVVGGIFNGLVHRGPIDMFYMSTPINHGMSGGPIVNGQNQLVAVNESMLVDTSQLSFGVPLSAVRRFLKENQKEEVHDKAFFYAKLKTQITDYQSRLVEQLMVQLKNKKKIEGVSIPDFSKYLKCWGSGDRQADLKFRSETEFCSNQYDIPIDRHASEGRFQTEVSVVENLSLNSIAWQNLISGKTRVDLDEMVVRYDQESTLKFSKLKCIRENIQGKEAPTMVSLCFQKIVEFKDLFDFYVSVYRPLGRTKFINVKLLFSGFTKPGMQKILDYFLQSPFEAVP